MPLIKVQIKNYKSIRDCTLNLDKVTVLLGENGTGKSNILSGIRYFYNNLVSRAESDEIFDSHNHLNNRVELALTYDLGRMKRYSYVNLRKESTKNKSYYQQLLKSFPQDEVTVRMVKIKDKPVRWSHDIHVRKLIFGLFPLYFVDTRKIDLVNWDVLWKHIGDLLKLENEVGQNLKDTIHDAIANADGQLKKRLEGVESMFQSQNVQISQYSKNEFAAALSRMYFSGEQYSFEENTLSEFSDGTNSFNFTYLLIYILKMIADTKMKEPIMILDEPEISLHNKMIDSLSEIFYESRSRVRFLMASHSARLVKDILRQDGEGNQLYQIYRKGYETGASRFRMFRQGEDIRERFFITDQHVSAYFAKALLLVEGETELEVFQNRFLTAVFPCLNQVEIMKGMSDDVVYRIVSPKDRKYSIPASILLDMDKIYTYKDRLKKKYFNLCKENECCCFFKKGDNPSSSRAVLAEKRKRIYNMAEKCRFHYEYPLCSSRDINYMEMIRLIREYFQEYGIFAARTTIEGMLVTDSNLEMFLGFLKQYYPKVFSGIYPFPREIVEAEDEVPFIRLMLGGKCDYVMGSRWIIECHTGMEPDLKDKLEHVRISKTRWVTDWLRYYFCLQMGLVRQEEQDIFHFLKKLEKKEEMQKLKYRFIRDFPELFQFIQMINQMV
ncbi:retron Eco8 family effector endonuclease [Lachnospiraceae bacterium 62-35]